MPSLLEGESDKVGYLFFGIFFFALPLTTMILTYKSLPKHTQVALKEWSNSI